METIPPERAITGGLTMPLPSDAEGMNARILAMKENAAELSRMARDFPAVYRNAVRIQASIKMLELNLTDLVDLEANGS